MPAARTGGGGYAVTAQWLRVREVTITLCGCHCHDLSPDARMGDEEGVENSTGAINFVKELLV